MVKLLAIDTATEACSAALLYDNAILERYELAPSKHSALILPMLQSLLDEAGITLAQLDVIAFGRGPGSFTGLRIAAGVAQGIAFAWDLPVVPVSTLQALAQAAYRELQASRVLAALNAAMQEVYWGVYQLDSMNLMQLVNIETVCAPEAVTVPVDQQWIGVGSGWDAYAEKLTAKVGQRLEKYWPQRFPQASDIVHLAQAEYLAGRTVAAEAALPVYIRDNVAKKSKEQHKA
jgi:tRNA threonylcarbamoyladenosine biosynthesis protein TsaB